MTASKTRPKAQQRIPERKTHKWADFQEEADRRAKGRDNKRPVVEPFVIDDVDPPIIIPPPDEKTTLLIAEQIGLLSSGLGSNVSVQRIIPLLRAFCGDQFVRVWAMLPDTNTTESINIVMQALTNHFEASLRSALEVAELPGGSEASSG
jgi:hypothetical protein